MHYPTLHPRKAGAYMRGPAVIRLKNVLRSAGYLVDSTDVYDAAAVKQLMLFQSQHQGPDGRYLFTDGIVGSNTWWAIENPSGPAQRSYLDHYVVEGLPAQRRKLLAFSRQLHLSNVREVPDGSNSGDGVDPIIAGFGAAPWCCLAVSYIFKQTLGSYPMNKRYALVLAMWEAAEAKGLARKVHDYAPIPGDAFVILNRNSRGQRTGTGHTGLVAAVSEDDEFFNTFAGNEGNRFKAGVRNTHETRDLVGFINFFGDSPKFEKGLFLAGSAANDTTR